MNKSAVVKSIFAGLVLASAPLMAQQEQQTLGSWGIETSNISSAVKPGDDFYQYVNEGWLKTAVLPQGLPRQNSFIEVQLRTEKQLIAIIDDLIAGQLTDAEGGDQVKNLYQSFMDEQRIETLGLAPIQAQLDAILALKDKDQVARRMADPMTVSIISAGVELHPMEPKRHTFYLSQAGLALPERSYYTSDQAPFPAIRQDYLQYMADTFSRAGLADAHQRGAAVLAFETALARIHWSPEEQRDRLKNYHPMTRAELLAHAPGFPWATFLDAYGVPEQDEFIVQTDSAVQKTASLMADTSLDTLRDYLAFHLINSYAPYLPKVYADANFAFFSTRLNGIKEQRERPLRGLGLVNGTLGELLGRIYVGRHFPANRKAEMERYIPYIREAFRARLDNSPWMDKATREQALAKLDSFTSKIAYPDRWKDYSAIAVDGGDLVGNIKRIAAWNHRDDLARLGEPVRIWEWSMPPQTVNAYYNFMKNEIVFPAAILQPPFFQSVQTGGDHAVNFGAIGAVIGHEMGHGFDDQGSKSDGNGVLRDWWTKPARQKFDAMGEKLAHQYDQFKPLPDTSVNGSLTLGENIGDLGGLALAYEAYQRFVRDELGGKDQIKDGFTGDQRFFMSWGQVWREIQTDDFLRKRLLTGPHSPNQYRVNGIVRNMDGWYKAFDVKPEDKLYLPPEQRVQIW